MALEMLTVLLQCEIRPGPRYCGSIKDFVVAHRCKMLFLGLEYLSNVLCSYIC